MTAIDLLHEFEQLGVRIWHEGNALKFEAPKGVMTPKRKNILLLNKSTLIEHFIAGDAPISNHLEHANDAPTPWERLKQRAMKAYECELKDKVCNLIEKGYSVDNAKVLKSEWRARIQRMRLSYEQADRLERELIQDGLLAYDNAGTCLVCGNGTPIKTSYCENPDFMLEDGSGYTFRQWLS